MGFLSGLKGLFAVSEASAKAKADSQEHQYQGFVITTQPVKVSGGYRVNGLITKDDLEHQFIRADLASTIDGAHELTLFKSRQAIDQMGETIFKS